MEILVVALCVLRFDELPAVCLQKSFSGWIHKIFALICTT